MLAPTQRRRFSRLLLLPLVAAIVLLAVAKLIALERADIVAELSDRVAHRDSPEAAAAVRQLAAMPGAPVSILVSAATSANDEVAAEARLCIGRLLRRAQRQIESGRRVGTVARQLAELAESLDAQQPMFSARDDAWLSSTTRKVLRLANRIPPQQTPLVAVHCDAILTAIAAKELTDTEIADSEPEVEESIVGEESAVEKEEPTRQAQLHRAVPVALEPRAMQGSRVVRESPDPAVAATDSVGKPATTARGGQAVAVASKHHDGSEQVGGNAPVETPAEELMNSPWRASWSHPIFRMAPARPINAASEDAASNAEVDAGSGPPRQGGPTSEAPAGDQEASEPPLAGVDSRELLRRWLDADGSAIHPLEEELTRRGFGRLSERFVQQLFSPKAEDRLGLVDDVLTEPGVDARPWLVLLSEDADADVRLLAVTIMATSNDAALVDKAWQVSIRDRDPRIARLAGRLRERREGGQRR